ncbi:hypothetical protein M413DRAFT_442972 [Hebeloma cylindrosporum]|uniref:F-box domain-containing protein n=1 Tax=Hebeloma cylindrosporum TaxID=76867 RepID=A0A0C3CJH3_HEBCY|nr:hypothetical protein M413DRAFT_442972 [Hebeloma cylindrosporum h7]
MPATDIHDIPPEILAAVFEIGIHTWGIHFISPLPRVCQHWQFVVDNTPRLWGIISVSPNSSPRVLEKQITKAKASPLSIRISSSAQGTRHNRVRQQLFALSANWVAADVGTAFLCESGTRWNALRYNLETLTLCRGNPIYDDPGSFFEGPTYHSHRQLALHTFSADSLPKAWTTGFLGPWIKHFYLRQWRTGLKIIDTWEYLARIPNSTTIELCQVQHIEHPDRVPPLPRTIVLRKLESLRLTSVKFAPTVLSAIAVPSLQTLSIRDASERWWWRDGPPSMSGFFAQWSQPSHSPTHLHTLELIDTLRAGDIPYLIHWLRRLPNLVRLLITDDKIGKAATSTTSTSSNGGANLYNALAYPYTNEDRGSSAWLCPSLMILYLDTAPELMDLIPIARSRGGIAPLTADIPPPARLRRLESHLCVDNQEELNELKSLIDEANCICTQCGLTIEDSSQ